MRCATVATLLVIIIIAAPALAGEDGTPASGAVHYLDEGWSNDQRQQFYYTTQGSQLIS